MSEFSDLCDRTIVDLAKELAEARAELVLERQMTLNVFTHIASGGDPSLIGHPNGSVFGDALRAALAAPVPALEQTPDIREVIRQAIVDFVAAEQVKEPVVHIDRLTQERLDYERELAAAHAREAALVKERDEARALLETHGFGKNSPDLDDALRQVLQATLCHRDNCNTLDGLLFDARRDNERLRGALEDAADSIQVVIDELDNSLEWDGLWHKCLDFKLSIQGDLAAPTPTLEQWRRERELRDAAVELAEHCANSDLRFDDQSTWYLMRDSLMQKYAALRAQRTANTA